MRCAAVSDGTVQNVLEIRPAHKLGYERATENRLIEVSEDMNVEIGDVYDAEAGVFLRNGVEVSEDGVIPALRARVAASEAEAVALKEENALLKAQIQAVSARGDFVEDVIAEMAMQVYR